MKRLDCAALLLCFFVALVSFSKYFSAFEVPLAASSAFFLAFLSEVNVRTSFAICRLFATLLCCASSLRISVSSLIFFSTSWTAFSKD